VLELVKGEGLAVRLDAELGRIDALPVERQLDDGERGERKGAVPVRVDLEGVPLAARGERIVAHDVLVEWSHGCSSH